MSSQPKTNKKISKASKKASKKKISKKSSKKKTAKKSSKKTPKKNSKKTPKKTSIKKATEVTKSTKFEPDYSFLPIWSKKSGKTTEEIKGMVLVHKAKYKKKYPKKSDEWIFGKARMRVAGIIKSDLQSTATKFYFRSF